MNLTVARGELRDVATRACLACGASLAMAQSLVEASLSANLCGRVEIGMAHLLDYLDGLLQGRIDGQAQPTINQPLPAIITADGHGGIAQLGFDLACDGLVTATRQLGVALFAQRNTFTAGELGYFARRLALDGLIALVSANSHAMMAVAAGHKPAFGTNPLAFGAPRPAPNPPLVFDQASSATAFVNLARAAEAGTPIPPGWAIDDLGQTTTDPSRAVLGALLPFGGAKGANIALMVEVLAAGMAGGAWSIDAGHFRSGRDSPGTGLTIVAIAPEAIAPDFALRLEDHLARLKSLGVHIPGQSARCGQHCDADPVPIEPDTLAAIERYARRLDDRQGEP